MYVCMCIYVCMYVCMCYAERKNLTAEIHSLSSLPHNVTLCLSPHCNTNSLNFHPTLHEISFLSPLQFMHQLCCTGINCLSFLERALLFKYLPTTLNTLILVTELSRTSQPLERFHKLLCIYYVLRLLPLPLPLLYDSLKTQHPDASFRRLLCHFSCTMSPLPSANCSNTASVHIRTSEHTS